MNNIRRSTLSLLGLAIINTAGASCEHEPPGDTRAYAELLIPHRKFYPVDLEYQLTVSVIGHSEDWRYISVPWSLVSVDTITGISSELSMQCDPASISYFCRYDLRNLATGKYSLSIRYNAGFTPIPDTRCGDTLAQIEVFRAQRRTVFMGIPPGELEYLSLVHGSGTDILVVVILAEFPNPPPLGIALEIVQSDVGPIVGDTAADYSSEYGGPYRLTLQWVPRDARLFIDNDQSTDSLTIFIKGIPNGDPVLNLRPFTRVGDEWRLDVPIEVILKRGRGCPESSQTMIYPDALPCALGGCP